MGLIYKFNDIEITNQQEILSFNDNELFDLNSFSFTSLIDNFDKAGVYSESMKSLLEKIDKVIPYQDIPILIQGETGTGKELVAQYIGHKSKGSFIGLNCSNLTKQLFESELFGYEKGSFTGAISTGKSGKLAEAQNGVLFLDEFTELPLDMQSKLLRVLQEREYYKVGGNKPEKVNTRFVFATNKNVSEMVKQGLFREDLYFRIQVCELQIPPLRQRRVEIIPLSVFILQNKIQMEYGKKISFIEAGVLKALYKMELHGNVRELINILSRLVIFNESDILITKSLDIKNKSSVDEQKLHFDLNGTKIIIADKPFSLRELENQIVRQVLEKFNGNKTKTSEFLKLNRIQMYGRYKDI